MLSKTKIKTLKWFSLWCAWLAAIVYCSWPLGYLLNRPVAGNGLASELEAFGQPYNWLFRMLDIVAGLLVVGVAVMLWSINARKNSRLLLAVLLNYAAFGVFTVGDALVPMTCVPALRSCGDALQDSVLVTHGIASILATVCLFLSVLILWWHIRKQHNDYIFILSIMMGGWILFGVASFVFFFVPGPGNLSQHYFITLCSIWVAMLPYIVIANQKTFQKQNKTKLKKRSKFISVLAVKL